MPQTRIGSYAGRRDGMAVPSLQRRARFYDALSLERPVYRAGRLAGITALGLRPGDRVLDVGCGTGLNLPVLRAAVGPGRSVIGVDASTAMLRQASARVRAAAWENVAVPSGDAADLLAQVTRFTARSMRCYSPIR